MAAPTTAGQESQDVPGDKLGDGDTKFGAVENHEAEAGAVTPVYEDLAEQDTIMQPDTVVPHYTGFDPATDGDLILM